MLLLMKGKIVKVAIRANKVKEVLDQGPSKEFSFKKIKRKGLMRILYIGKALISSCQSFQKIRLMEIKKEAF